MFCFLQGIIQLLFVSAQVDQPQNQTIRDLCGFAAGGERDLHEPIPE